MKPLLRFVTVCQFLGVISHCGATRTNWNDSGTDFQTPANWTLGAPTGDNVGAFASSPAVQPHLASSDATAGLVFFGAGYDLTAGAAAVLSLTGQASTVNPATGETDSSNSVAIAAHSSSGLDTMDLPVLLAPSVGNVSTFYTAGETLVLNGAISGNGVSLLLRGGIITNPDEGKGGQFILSGSSSYSGNTTLPEVPQ